MMEMMADAMGVGLTTVKGTEVAEWAWGEPLS